MWVSGVFVTPGGMLDVGGIPGGAKGVCGARVAGTWWQAHGYQLSGVQITAPRPLVLAWEGLGVWLRRAAQKPLGPLASS
jgi:hypothetical protein